MLDTETKSRIDSARDILVGKVPDPKSQVEQITIALIYKFMDDMDRQSEELGGKASFFTGGFKKFRWAQLLDKRFSGHERLSMYAEGIEKMNENKNIPQLFRDIFKGVFLPYRDPETLNLFLKEINGFTYDHSEQLGDAFEHLLSVLGSQGEAGQFRTPRHIIDFVITLLNPKKSESILDPACGTAGFLISSFKHIQKTNADLTPDERARLMTTFCGYDISPDMVRLSRANMYLHGFLQPRIHEYDTLTSEDRWDERYDVILANPPFMTPKGGIRPHNRFMIKAKRSEILFVDYIAEHLNAGGRAGVIVPDGVITGNGSASNQLQKLLVDGYDLQAIISLPAGTFLPYARAKTSVLIFRHGHATSNVWFSEIGADGFTMDDRRQPTSDNDIPRILNLWKRKSDSALSVLVSAEEIRRNGYDLRIGRYLPLNFVEDPEPTLDVSTAIESIRSYSAVLPDATKIKKQALEAQSTVLDKLIKQVSRRVPVAPDATYSLLGVKWYGEGPFLRETLPGSKIEAPYLYQVREGDIIYNRLFAWKGSFGVISADLDGCYVSNEFPAFRIRDEKRVSAAFIKFYLRCPTLWRIAERFSTGTSSTSRNRFAISDFLAIPFPGIAKCDQDEFVLNMEAIQGHLEKIRKAEVLCDKILSKMLSGFGPWLVSGWRKQAVQSNNGKFSK